MSFTVLRRIALCAALTAATCTASAADKAPRILREPILGLRYELARVKFDPLPIQSRANCETLVDDERGQAVWFVFAQARDAGGRTYYVTGGYEIRHRAPQHRKYEVDGLGLIFFTERDTCTYVDSARQVFDDRLFDDEVPQSILTQLAGDLAKRYVRAFGGAEQLRTELRNQRVDADSLPPELREAFKPYLDR